MAGLLWTIIVILVILWLIGWIGFHLASWIWILLVIAVILVIVNLLTGRGARL